MTEAQVIAGLQQHINSGKLVLLQTREPQAFLPATFDRFYFNRNPLEPPVWVEQPITLVRLATPEEVRENWYVDAEPPEPNGNYYVCAVD